ncbi:hypothetical protein SAMN05444287_3167 [Octadecabacter temperatus]|uniref:Uncharacterized protein n=1 Tax=Octadecabacter temperatus TaxID=1458307 RepID=A0A0K0Y8A3_9RHOB|nr:hypothetical protein [Octadecabacter temperatus]AKS47193.1 hypothetical protein OSB_26690 [Octadecabacter temperatus]SIO45453.1 hypothetical protein SAMN05444287_3167 [Octadecabacter temperatus]
MGEVLKAEWFDLNESSRDGFCAWLHNEYLPAVQATQGVGWVGHYEIVPIPHKPYIEGAPWRKETTDPSIPTGWENVILTAGMSPEVFFGLDNGLDELTADNAEKLSTRENYRSAVFIEEQVINAPDQRKSPYGMGPPPAMQLGNYNTNAPEDEEELARWYRAERFARVSVTEGMIRGRKMISMSGWPKHGVLWEFTDLPEGDSSFEHRFVAADRDENWEGRHVLEYVTHAVGSPHAGRRVWPKV